MGRVPNCGEFCGACAELRRILWGVCRTAEIFVARVPNRGDSRATPCPAPSPPACRRNAPHFGPLRGTPQLIAENGGFDSHRSRLHAASRRGGLRRRGPPAGFSCSARRNELRGTASRHPSTHGGEWGIRTPEGLHPTRFPSVRHRPLGEFSRDDCAADGDNHSQKHTRTMEVAPRVAPSRPTPPGRKRSKGNRALAGARGVFTFLARPAAMRRAGLSPSGPRSPRP